MDGQGRYVEVRGTRLYVYEIGDADAPALLYLHGGPGMGCHEFVQWQGRALGRHVRLIAVDQRGFHHSDPVGEDEPLTEAVFVEDCEALRLALGVESWFVLGHSYGGRLALRYAAEYPGCVRGVLFENPAWNVASSQRFRMRALADIYRRHGRIREAEACRELAASANVFVDFPDDPLRLDLIGGITGLGEAWYLYDRSDTGFISRMDVEEPLHPEAEAGAEERLRADPLNAQDLLPLLAGLRKPARLIVGEADLVTAPDQIASFAAVFGRENVHRVEQAGHFVQGEQPELYTRLVLDFVTRT
jgi:proline iminopeptidase